MNKKFLVALNSISTQQDTANESTNEAINHLLYYLATYPNDGIVYRASSMVLAAHVIAVFRNESKGRSRVVAHVFIAEDEPAPRWNGPILTLAQVIKFVMSSAPKAELSSPFISAKELVPIRLTLIDMGWPRPPTSIQTDNSTSAGVVNNTIIAQKKVHGPEITLVKML